MAVLCIRRHLLCPCAEMGSDWSVLLLPCSHYHIINTLGSFFATIPATLWNIYDHYATIRR